MGIGRISRIGRVGRVGGGIQVFDPDTLTNLTARYTAGPTWCFTDVGGTTPAGHNDPVALWVDRAGAVDLTQATESMRPLLISSGGKWLMRFAATDIMTNATGLTENANAVSLTVAGAVAPSVATADLHFLDLSSGFVIFTTQTDTAKYGWYDGTWRSSGTASATGNQVVVWKPNSGAGVGTIRKAGVDLTTTLTYNPGAKALDGVWLGQNHTGGNQWTGDVYELLVAKSDVTGTQLTGLESYLQSLF